MSDSSISKGNTASTQTLIKVGALALISIVLLTGCLLWLRGKGFSQGPAFRVSFQDVDGMRDGAPVQMMGIRVGFVDQVKALQPQQARSTDPPGNYQVGVTFSLQNDKLRIPRGSKLSIEQSGIIGEKFLEITPPLRKEISLEIPPDVWEKAKDKLGVGMPVKTQFVSGWLTTGQVENWIPNAGSTLLSAVKNNTIVNAGLSSNPRQQLLALAHKTGMTLNTGISTTPVKTVSAGLKNGKGADMAICAFRITRPGAMLPEDPVYTLALDEANNPYLKISDLPKAGETRILADLPDPRQYFTIENPLRIKRFLEIQLESAEALKITNEKINQLLSDKTIESLNSTVKNTEILTARATQVLNNANQLFQSTASDLDTLVSACNQLALNINSVSANLNEVIGDPKLKNDIQETVNAVRTSATSLKALATDPALKASIDQTQKTSKSAAEVVGELQHLIKDKQLPERVDQSVNQLNSSLGHLNSVLQTVDNAVNEPGAKNSANGQQLKVLLQDAKSTTGNLKKFSEKINKHFALFRLLF